jgi:hypothetical protein
MPVWMLIAIVFFLLWRDKHAGLGGRGRGPRFGGEYSSPDGSIRGGGATTPPAPRAPAPRGFERQRAVF